MNLAIKDIQHNIGRFALTSVGIGMLLMIVMGMSGIYRGIIEDATLLIDNIGADIWIVQHNTRGPFAELSRVPQNLIHRALAIPGVVTARNFVQHTIQRRNKGKRLRMTVVGLDWPIDKGKWVPLVSGRILNQNHYEMIADKSLDLHLGEKIKLGKNTYTVVGITSSMISSGGDGIGFFSVQDALEIQFDTSGEAVRLERISRSVRVEKSDLGLKQPGLIEFASQESSQVPALASPQASSVILKLGPGANLKQVMNIIAGWEDVSVYTSEGERQLLLKGSVEKVRKQIGLFRILLTIISAIIMALILYTLTLDKLHSIALLKLIGASNWIVLKLILQQALILGMLGYGIAYFLGQKIFPLFPRRVILSNDDLLQLAIIVLVISVVSSFLGIWKALQVNPNEALN
jgi:putative ABC transport system permease protein